MPTEEQKERHRIYMRERTRKRKEAGICTRCGKLPAEEGHTLCPACRLIGNNHSKKLYEKRSNTQKCTKCGKRPRVKESNLCRTCSNKRKEAQKAIRDRHRENFECMQCGKPLEASERGRVTRCFDCREKNQRYKAERAANRRTEADYKKREATYPENMEMYLNDLVSSTSESKKRKQSSTKSKSTKPSTAVNAVLSVAKPTIETITKKCPVCGKVFHATKFSHQKYCCRDCKNEAAREYRKFWPSAKKDYKKKNKTVCNPTQQPTTVQVVKKGPEPVAYADADLKLQQTVIDVAGTQCTMYHCYKMPLKAMNLPCGKREECYLKPRCPFIPEGFGNMKYNFGNQKPSFCN